MVDDMKRDPAPKETVLSFIRALNAKDYDEAQRHVSGDFSFRSPVLEILDPDGYFKSMKQLMIRYEIRKVFADSEDVCLFYDYTIGGVTRFGCGWYRVKGGKISSLRILSDVPPGAAPGGK